MPDTYAGSPVFPTSITIPKDGEAANVASANVAWEGNRDAVVYLKTKTDAIDGQPFRNLRNTALYDTSNVALSFAHFRPDGTNTAFFAPSFNFWIKCGVNTAAHIVLGDRNGWFDYDTGAASTPPKVSFGCDSASLVSPGRVCVFNADLHTSGGGTNVKYIIGPASGDYTGTWTTRSLDAIGSFISYYRAWDCVVTPTQRVIVVGGGDVSGAGQFLAWKSDDFGFSFTRVTVGNVSASQDGLTRVICGKNGRLVSWIKTSAANQGNKLFYSDDNGNTWSSRSAIGFDQITDGAYLADLDLWVFSSDNGPGIYTVQDPAMTAFSYFPLSFGPVALAGFGHYVLYSVTVGSVWKEIYLTTNATITPTFVGRIPNGNGYDVSNIAASPRGDMLISTAASLTQTGRL